MNIHKPAHTTVKQSHSLAIEFAPQILYLAY